MKVLGSYRMKNGFIIDGPRMCAQHVRVCWCVRVFVRESEEKRTADPRDTHLSCLLFLCLTEVLDWEIPPDDGTGCDDVTKERRWNF